MKISSMSRVSNPINRNIDEDRNNADADIEILNINSPDTQDSEGHEESLNEAWRFITVARHQNYTENDSIQRTSRNDAHFRMHDPHQFMYEDTGENYIYRPNVKRPFSWDQTVESKKYDREFCFSAINDYLDTLENSSEEENPNTIKQNYFNNEHAPEEAVEVFDGTIYAVANEGPMFIYSYKNKNYTSNANENLINSPHQESQSNSTGSISVENFNEESISYEKSFYRISTSFQPVIIPRLPLATYMLPTVTEIIESNRQSPKITELSNEDIETLKRKPTNSWVMKDEESSQSDANNTTETNIEISADELSVDNSEQSSHSDSKIQEIEGNTNGCDRKIFLDLHLRHSRKTNNSRSSDDASKNKYSEKDKLKQRNNYLDASDIINIDSEIKGHMKKDSIKSEHHENSNPIALFSVHSSIPSLHLSLSTEANTNKQSWFKRFIACILCCK